MALVQMVKRYTFWVLTIFVILIGIGVSIFSYKIAKAPLPLTPFELSRVLAKTPGSVKESQPQELLKIDDLREEVRAFKTWTIDQTIKMVGIILTIVGVVVGLLGLAGKGWASDYVKRTVDAELKNLNSELLGRLTGYVGLIFWRMHKIHPGAPGDEFLDDAIDFTQGSYQRLSESSEWKITAANNLAYYLAERGEIANALSAVNFAKMLREHYTKTGDINSITTYARVVARYSDQFDNPKQALLEAKKMMEDLIKNDKVSPKDKKSAAGHCEKILAALTSTGG